MKRVSSDRRPARPTARNPGRLRDRLPRRLRRVLRWGRLALLDLWELASGRRPPLVPPRRRVESIGGLDFVEVGRHLASLAVEVGRLRPDERVLDVGSGIGRFAVPMATYLSTGRYEGFDLHRWGVRWCRTRITPRHPNLRFTHVDLRNGHYNPRGAIDPATFAFPYPDAAFDLVFAASLFTHLSPSACERYLRESARVLAPGGRLLASFFLLNDANRPGSDRPDSALRFPPSGGVAAATDPRDPEAAVAYEQAWLESTLSAAGLSLVSLHLGTWPGRTEGRSFQDLVLARSRDERIP